MGNSTMPHSSASPHSRQRRYRIDILEPPPTTCTTDANTIIGDRGPESARQIAPLAISPGVTYRRCKPGITRVGPMSKSRSSTKVTEDFFGCRGCVLRVEVKGTNRASYVRTGPGGIGPVGG